MKRWQIGLIGCTLLILLSGSALAQPTDVAPGHWAYTAVQTLVSRGYMDVDPSGAFDGEQSVQRYDLAVALAHLLDDIEAGRVQISAGVDVDLLRGLEREFRAELVQWYDQRDSLEAAHGQTQRHIAVIDEQLNMLLLALDELHTSVRSELSAALAAEEVRSDELLQQEARRTDLLVQGEAQRTDDLFATANARIRELQDLVLGAFGEYGESVGAQFDEQLSAMASLRQELNALIEAVEQNVYTALEQLAADVDDQRTDVDDLDQRVNRINDHAAALVFRLNDLEQLLKEELISSLEEQRVHFDARLSDVQAQTERLESDLAALSAALELTQATAGADAEASQLAVDRLHGLLDGLLDATDNDINELRAAIAFLEARLADAQRAAAEQKQLLEEQDAQLSQRLDRVEHNVDNVLFGLRLQDEDRRALAAQIETDQAALRAEVDALAREVSQLQDIMGTSEEQIARMTERVRTQLDDQLALSLSRERNLERQLNELQAEFEGYKKQAAEEVSSARSMGTMALGAAALAILLSLMN